MLGEIPVVRNATSKKSKNFAINLEKRDFKGSEDPDELSRKSGGDSDCTS